MAERGQLTAEVQTLMEEFLGRETCTTELRLIPYLQFLMVNEQRIDPVKINGEERAIFQQWKQAGHVEGGMTGLRVTEDFWNFMCRVLFVAYVDYENREG